MSAYLVTARLLQTIRAAAPAVTDIRVGVRGDPATVAVTPASEQATAQAAVNAFDWSDAAQAAWELDQMPNLKALRQQAANALAANAAFLALASPTPAQTLAQVRALTQQNTAVINRLQEIVS